MKENKISYVKAVGGDFLKTAVYALLAVLLFRVFFYEPFFIPSGSMKPGLLEGDYIFVSKFRYGYSRHSLPLSLPLIKKRILGFNKPKRGEVLVFRLPSDMRVFYIKRLVGLPGDKIQIKDGILFINDQKIRRRYDGEFFDTKYNQYLMQYKEELTPNKEIAVLQEKVFIDDYNNTAEYIVPEGYYFFLGDNRDNSLDSRFEQTGLVPEDNVVGRADLIFYSKEPGLINVFKIRFKRIFKIIR